LVTTYQESVPFVDLAAQYQTIKSEIDLALHELLGTAQFVLGPAVENFEDNFAAYVGTAYAVGVGSGLDALKLTLATLDVGPSDEVILPANTFIATALAVTAVGALPVLVDCEETSYNIDPGLLEDAVTTRTKAIIAVHFGGQPADINAIRQVTERHGLPLIEDAAQAHGATYQGRRCGSLADVGCFSFYPSKNLGAYGDGGMVTTDNSTLAERIRELRNYGQRQKYDHVIKGVNSRLDALQATVLDVKLRHLDRWNRARACHAALYRELLQGLGDLDFQQQLPDSLHIYHLFTIAATQREALRRNLKHARIQTAIHYPTPIHLQEAYKDLGYSPGDFPCAERLSGRLLSLPMYSELTADQIRHVARNVEQFFTDPTKRHDSASAHESH